MKTYSEKMRLQIRDCDLNAAWRPGALQQALQEISGAHSLLLGAGRDSLLDMGVVWILTRIEVRMDRYPKVDENIELETFPTPCRRWFFPRWYRIRDDQGKEIGRAGSLWALLDLHERKMIQPGKVAALMPDNRDLPAPLGLPATVTQVSGTLSAAEYMPRYSDIDLNGHVNNTRYVDWACDALGIDAMRDYELAHFAVNYNQEIRPGETVHTELRRMGNVFSFSGTVDGRNHFDLGGELRPRP